MRLTRQYVALGNIDGLLGYIAADQFETEEYALLFATFVRQRLPC